MALMTKNNQLGIFCFEIIKNFGDGDSRPIVIDVSKEKRKIEESDDVFED